MISASLIQYGGEIAKDTLQVPMWSPWLNSVAYPIAYMIIGSQIMALVLQVCGKRNSEYRWIKTGVPDSCCSNPCLDDGIYCIMRMD